MTQDQQARETSSRDTEGPSAFLSRPRGRAPAPRVSNWLPFAAKVAVAAGGIAVFAILGANAGAHSPTSDVPTLASSGPPPVPAAAALGQPQPPPLLPSADGSAESTQAVLDDGRVVLNAASEDDLIRLPGIGPVRARAIMALRQRLVRFRAVEDLLRVKGIGRKTLKRIKPGIVLDRPPKGDGGTTMFAG